MTVARRAEQRAEVAELADAQDLKSWDLKGSCGFDSRPRHQGSYPAMTLAEARTLALDKRHLIDVEHLDPVVQEQAAQALATPTASDPSPVFAFADLAKL